MKLYVKFLIGFYIFAALGVMYLVSFIPSDKQIKSCMTTTMFEVYLCPGSKDYVPLSQISQNVQKALILAEDANFYNHNGFDWEAIQASAEHNMAAGKYLRGGSTLTQQLAKNMFLSRDKTLIRKALEAVITYRLETVLSKKEILERYLNVVQFGKDLFGIRKAAQFYFRKHPADLDAAESAFLVMLLPNPEKYSRSFSKKSLTPFANKRVNKIVNDMYRYHRISIDEYFRAQEKISQLFAGARKESTLRSQEPAPEPKVITRDAKAPSEIVDEPITEKDLMLEEEEP